MPRGRASAPAAGTILNALATGVGSAFAIDVETTATVELETADSDDTAVTGNDGTAVTGSDDAVTGDVAGVPDADTRLVERCVELVAATAGTSLDSGHVRTESEIPMAAGLKSSSAAANATVLATFDALDVPVRDGPTADATGVEDGDSTVTRVDACLLGVQAARDTGVTVTGAFDDASASMLGSLTVTDNEQDTVLHRDDPLWEVAVWTPPEQAFSADADVERCRAVRPMADLAADLALGGQYGRAMTVNGLAFCAALDFPADPLVDAMDDVTGVSLSGTGPSVVAIGDGAGVERVADRWADYDGETWLTTTETDGGRQG